MEERAVSQAEFARLVNRSPAAISQYKNEGKLDPSCFTVRNGKCLVLVDRAVRRLGEVLDPIKRQINGKPLPDPAMSEPVTAEPMRELPLPLRDTANVGSGARAGNDLTAERTRAIRLQNLERIEKRRLADGTYCRTADVTPVFADAINQIVAGIESELPSLAESMAASYEMPPRELLFELKEWFRGVMDRSSRIQASMAERLPRYEQDAVDDGDSTASLGAPSGGGGGSPGAAAPAAFGL